MKGYYYATDDSSRFSPEERADGLLSRRRLWFRDVRDVGIIEDAFQRTSRPRRRRSRRPSRGGCLLSLPRAERLHVSLQTRRGGGFTLCGKKFRL